MSSHREAPEISKDPSADNTDVYAFVSPDKPDTVTLIANYLPFELPYGGPNFNEFDDGVTYEIKISNRGDARADIVYRFQFSTRIRNDATFLYNTGPITSPSDASWNRPQTYTLTRLTRGHGATILGRGLTCPPVNVGVHSTPDYPSLAAQTYHSLAGNRRVFAGQRADGFHVDLGSIFDLGDLRPFQGAYNEAKAVIGVWATANRSTARIRPRSGDRYRNLGTSCQVSRLGNPLVNEVINPMAYKDRWNAQEPSDDKDFAKYVLQPELANLIANVLYPAAFPNLAVYVKANKPRNDLAAILLTGIPSGIVPGFQNYTGPVQADMLRLNVAVPPTAPGQENPIGLVAGDPAGFPNGRRLIDDVTAIELKAVAGATIPLVDNTFTPDAAAAAVNDGTTNDNTPYGEPFLASFPYLSNPNSGFTTRPGTPGGGSV